MKNQRIPKKEESFYLRKWFLDFVSDKGEAMIFYIALLKWRRFEVHYTSWMHYHPKEGVKNSSRLMKVHFPNISDNIVNWNDPVFGIEGTWEAMTAPLQSRIFESNEGYIQWNCIQPSSVVDLRINNEQYKCKQELQMQKNGK